MDLEDEIARWIAESRKAADLSGEALGARLALELGTERGHTKANISHWETKKHQPSLQQILAISRITGCPLPPALLRSLGASNDAARQRDPTLKEVRRDELLRLMQIYLDSDAKGRERIMDAADQVNRDNLSNLGRPSTGKNP